MSSPESPVQEIKRQTNKKVGEKHPPPQVSDPVLGSVSPTPAPVLGSVSPAPAPVLGSVSPAPATAPPGAPSQPHTDSHEPQQDANAADAKLSKRFQLGRDPPVDGIVYAYTFMEHGPVPLENLGNTCYLNSVMQCLFVFPGFLNNLLKEWEVIRAGNHDEAYKMQMTLAVVAFWHRYRHYTALGKISLTSCRRLNDDLKSLLKAVGAKNRHFTVKYRQQDAAELLDLVINGMRDEITEVYRKHSMPQDQEVLWRWIYCKKAERLACGTCGRGTQLPVATDCALRVTFPENEAHLDGDPWDLQLLLNSNFLIPDAVPCVHTCDGMRTKSLKFEKLSKILFIFLARYDENMEKRGDEVKANKEIFIGREFLANNFVAEPGTTVTERGVKYRLKGMVRHSGNRLDAGHYISYVCNDVTRKWYKCNDAVIWERTPSEAILRCMKTGYCFFYGLDAKE